MMVMGNKKLPITDILIGDRGRKKLGNIDKLSKDILKNNLIVPILITEDNELIDGGRRLAAFELLGRDTIDCTIARLVESDDILQLEFSANENRKDFTRKEKLALFEKLKLPISNEKGINQYTKEDGGPIGPPSKKNRRGERAKAVGFSSVKEARQVKRVDDKGVDGLLDLVEDGVITLNASYNIAALEKADQDLAIIASKKYGSGKWWYYELPQTLINNMENKTISRDECDGYMLMYRDGKMSSREISQKISHRSHQIDKAKVRSEAMEKQAEIEHNAKWDTIEVSLTSRIQSFRHFLEFFGTPDKKDITWMVNQVYSELTNEVINKELENEG